MVAHDRGDLAGRDHPSLVEALDAFTRAPLDQVEIDVDVKLAGREEEIVAAVREQGLSDRVMFSGMELESLRALAQLAPEMRRGWTLPKVSGDWRRSTLAKPFLRAAMANLRARLPRVVASRAAELGVWSVWVFHPLVSPRLVESAHASGLAVFAWTVDDVERQRELVALGVDGLVSNDPRTFRESIGVAAA
ncbi:MAG: glycerophosphodiester phosphodiesterase [Solirubrobacterales bacterium]|nr:glycerophosphodiester phosphodiesterase [Solirubrobacterales bacterium]